jgi:hypothetical protein
MLADSERTPDDAEDTLCVARPREVEEAIENAELGVTDKCPDERT